MVWRAGHLQRTAHYCGWQPNRRPSPSTRSRSSGKQTREKRTRGDFGAGAYPGQAAAGQLFSGYLADFGRAGVAIAVLERLSGGQYDFGATGSTDAANRRDEGHWRAGRATHGHVPGNGPSVWTAGAIHCRTFERVGRRAVCRISGLLLELPLK